MLDDPHLIADVPQQILKQVNFSFLRGKDTLLHFSSFEFSVTEAKLALTLSNLPIKLSTKLCHATPQC